MLVRRLPFRFLPLEERIAPAVDLTRPHVDGELLVSLKATDALFDLTGYAVGRQIDGIDLAATRLMLQDRASGLVQLKLRPGADAAAVASQLESCAGVGWVSLNYLVDMAQSAFEFTPNDPYYTTPLGPQYALDKMQVPAAWDLTTGSSQIVVAVLDSGADRSHPDFNPTSSFWINDDTTGNSIDDDGNGYINDRFGWDFVNNDNNPDPEAGYYHGNHVAGIIAARTNNSQGIAGVAGGKGTTPGARIMNVRVYEGTGPLPVANVVNGLTYAVNNGAKIINMSLKSDAFTADPAIASALDYAYDTKQALIFFSAGNSAEENPARAEYTHPIYVAATDANDKLWYSGPNNGSNYGSFVDIAAPGVDIWSTYDRNSDDVYFKATGTSAAAPNAAGVAALIWSNEPYLSRDQVGALLFGTADNIDSLNPGYAGKLGAGRVNALRALTELPPVPKIAGFVNIPAEGGVIAGLSTFSVLISSRLDGTTVTSSAIELRADGNDNTFDTADDVAIPINVVTYRLGSDRIDITLPVEAVSDRYRLTIRSGPGGLASPFGTALDGNGDGVGGDSTSRTFFVLSAGVDTDEFRVNTQTTSEQSAAKVAIDASGNATVVWRSNGQDGNGFGIYGQRFNSAGVKVGNEFQVNTSTAGDQLYPTIDIDDAGQAIVAWESELNRIVAQRFSSLGIKIGGEIEISAAGAGLQWAPSVAASGDGSFTCVWERSLDGGSTWDVFGRRYDSSGSPMAAEYSINSYVTGSQILPYVAADEDGDTMVVWQSGGPQPGIFAQRYGSSGNAVGGNFRVNDFDNGGQLFASVAMAPSGDALVVWQSNGQDGSGDGIYGRWYDAAGKTIVNEFRINSHTTGNQSRPSVALDSSGNATVFWESDGQDSPGTAGIYGQKFDSLGNKLGQEFRANDFVAGQQRGASVAMDPIGGAFVAWHDDGQDGSSWGIFGRRYGANASTSTTIAQLRAADGNILDSNERSLVPISGLVAAFNRAVTTSGGTSGPISVTNPANWKLARDGVDISGTISGITFGYSPTTNLFEAGISLSTPLIGGSYSLTAEAAIQDTLGNPIDGNADGVPGGDFVQAFRVEQIVRSGPEFPVNTYTASDQKLSTSAIDAEGNALVVWVSNGQDGGGQGIYGQRFDAAGAKLGDEFRVNTYTTNDQYWPSVAMDADGSAVVVWTSSGQDGSDWGIYGQRFGPTGVKVGDEFQVNTYTTDKQFSPSVAMDADGDSYVVWQSGYGQDGSGWGIFGQRFDQTGVKVGNEFQVNTYTTSHQRYPRVAVSGNGNAVVAWDSLGQDGSLYGIYAQRFDAAGTKIGGEFPVSTYTGNNQRDASVAIDADGDTVVVWVSQGQDGSGYGVYGQRFDAAGAKVGGEIQVNTYTTGSQALAFVDADADGNVLVVWESNGSDGNGYGVAGQRFAQTGAKIGGEFQINTFTADYQAWPSVAVGVDGSGLVTWQSKGQDGAGYGIYAQRYAPNTPPTTPGLPNVTTPEDVAPPTIDLWAAFDDANDADSALSFSVVANSKPSLVIPGTITAGQLPLSLGKDQSGSATITVRCTDTGGLFTDASFVVNVTPVNDAPTFIKGIDQVVPSKYAAVTIPNWITGIMPGPADEASQKLTFDIANTYDTTYFTTQPAISPTGTLSFDWADGKYGAVTLLVRVRDDGGMADGGVDVSSVQALTITGKLGFDHSPLIGGSRVNSTTTGSQLSPAVASDAVGNYAVAWVGQDGDGTGIFVMPYAADRTPRTLETAVNTTTTGTQSSPAIAIGAAGDMFVVWSGNGVGDADGIFLQRFNSDGVKVGGETLINVTITGTQSTPQIAVDLAGNYVVAWQGAGTGNDIWYRRFSAAGTALDLADVRANSSTAGEQTLPSLAVDAEGDFTLAWADGVTPNLDIRARFFSANGTPFGADFRVNTYSTNDQTAPHVSLDADGDAIIVWQSFGQSSGWDIFAQRVSRAGSLSGTEFQLNAFTTGDQTSPRVAYDADGDLAAVWVSNNQVAGSGTDVFQRLYDRAGTSLQSIETRLNRTITGNQSQPAIMADADGDFAVTWAGYGKTDSDGVFVQRNTFFLPEITGLPSVTVTGGTPSTVISLFDYYLDDPNFSEASTFYFVQNTGTSPGLFSSVTLNPNSGRLTVAYATGKHGESPIKVRVRDTTELPLDVTFVARVLPTIGTIAPQVVDEGSTFTLTPTGSTSAMAGGANLWSLDSAPSGMSIDSATGKVTWTPGDGPLSTTFTIRLSSTLVPAITSTRTVSIAVNNVAPTATGLTGPGTTAVGESAAFTLSGATDVSLADITAGLKYSFDFDGDGTFEITKGSSASVNYVYPADGSFTAGARVEDKDGGFTDYTVPVTVLKANNSPTLDTIANQSATEGVAYGLQTVAGDVDAGQSLTYSFDAAPPGMTISGTGLIEWTPTEAQGPGSYPVTVRVTDNGLPNKSATRSFMIDVAEVNSAPQIAPISNFTVNEGQLLSFSALGTDPDDTPANALTYSLDAGFPAGAGVHATSGLFQWIPADNGVSVITLRVTDDGVPALSATRTFTVTVNNIAPTATSLTGPASAKVGESAAFTLNGVSDAAGDTPTLKYSFDWTNDGTFDVVDSPSPTQNTMYGTAGPYTVRAKVTDKDGASSEYTTNITITSSAPAGPKVQGVTVNDGSAQRSRVTSLTVAFNSPVDFAGNPADAFVLTRQGGGNVTIAGVEVSGSTAKLTFAGPTTQFGSLIDGRYTLTILAGQVSAGGTPLDGNGDGTAGDDYSLVGTPANGLFRLYGDADGNGQVTSSDFLAFRLAFLSPSMAFDYNDSGTVDSSDFLQFRLRFLQVV